LRYSHEPRSAHPEFVPFPQASERDPGVPADPRSAGEPETHGDDGLHEYRVIQVTGGSGGERIITGTLVNHGPINVDSEANMSIAGTPFNPARIVVASTP